MNEIKTAVAEYTGGGIYLYYGELTNGMYFMTADNWCCEYYGDFLIVVKEKPDKDECWTQEWVDKNCIMELYRGTSLPLWNEMLCHIIKNNKEGKYLEEDLRKRININFTKEGIEMNRKEKVSATSKEKLSKASTTGSDFKKAFMPDVPEVNKEESQWYEKMIKESGMPLFCYEDVNNNEEEEEKEIDFSMTPHEIVEYLNQYIVGQDNAKKALAVAIYNHNKRLNDTTGLIRKSNILMAGPSGTGKTLLAQTLAKILNVPFAIADATSLTEAGYVGDDVENCLLRLIQAADGDIKKAEKGIIYIDEIDKIGRKSENPSITRDVSGEGVQQALLKIIEGAEVNVPLRGGRKHPQGDNPIINTENILFICGGAFEGMIGKDTKNTSGSRVALGFDSKKEEKEDDKKVTSTMFKKFGLLPELIGRLPVIVQLDDLDKDDLIRILTEPKNAITKEYETLLAADGVELIFEESALSKIADKAIEKKTGARGLRGIMEEIMLDIMYDIPSDKSIAKCYITEETVENGVIKTESLA